MYVQERYNFIVFVDKVCRNFLFDYLAEDAVIHFFAGFSAFAFFGLAGFASGFANDFK